MADELIPKNDDDFNKLQAQFVTAVAAAPAAYGVPAADVTQMQADQATWNTAYPAHVKAQEEAQTAAEKKNASRTKLEADVRGAAKHVNGTPGVDNALRVSAGMKPHADDAHAGGRAGDEAHRTHRAGLALHDRAPHRRRDDPEARRQARGRAGLPALDARRRPGARGSLGLRLRPEPHAHALPRRAPGRRTRARPCTTSSAGRTRRASPGPGATW